MARLRSSRPANAKASSTAREASLARIKKLQPIATTVHTAVQTASHAAAPAEQHRDAKHTSAHAAQASAAAVVAPLQRAAVKPHAAIAARSVAAAATVGHSKARPAPSPSIAKGPKPGSPEWEREQVEIRSYGGGDGWGVEGFERGAS